MISDSIALIGCGAIGSSVFADLTRQGYDVCAFDQWPAHVEAMKSSGLRIMMPDDDFTTPVRAHHLCELASLQRQFDIVLLAVKSGDTKWMTQLVTPYLKPDGMIIGLQNGMNDEAIHTIAGIGRTVGCVVELSAEVFTPGLVQRYTTRKGTWFGLGELHGRTTLRLKKVEELLAHTARVSLTNNIAGAKWTKLITNSMTQGPIGMLGIKSGSGSEIPGVFEISIGAGRETIAVGNKLGYVVEPVFGLTAEEFAGSTDEVLKTILTTILSHVGPKSRNAVVQDHQKGRLTEIEWLNGIVARHGRALGVPTPYNDAICEITRQITAGKLKPDLSNVARLRSLLA